VPRTSTTPTDEVERWSATVDQLAGRLAAAEAECASLSARRRTLVLPAQTGDADAAAELARQDAGLDRMQREVRDLGQALEDARTELRDAEERAAEAARQRNLARAAELDAQAAALAAKVDSGLAAVRSAIEELAPLVREADRLRAGGVFPQKGRANFLVGIGQDSGLRESGVFNGVLAFHGLRPGAALYKHLLRPFAAALFGGTPAAGSDPETAAAGEDEAAA
jgi:hypothetical protein